MTAFIDCAECRPIWQEFRRHVAAADLPPDRRKDVIETYMGLVHDAGHDEDAVRERLRAEAELAEIARAEIRRVVSVWAHLSRRLTGEDPDAC